MSGWTSSHLWGSFKAAKEKQEFWLRRAEAHLSRKKPCEGCAREKEYGGHGCSVWFDAAEKADKWERDANSARTYAQKKEREEGKPLTIDGTKPFGRTRDYETKQGERQLPTTGGHLG